VRVTSVPTGAEVFVGGRPQATAPCDVTLPEGRGTLEIGAHAPGYFDESRIIDLAAPPAEVRLSLRAVPAPAAAHQTVRPTRPAARRHLHRDGTVDPFDDR
jgi:hypothetical protein